MHGAPKGHLSSYSFALMSIFYLQVKHQLPTLQGNPAVPPLPIRDALSPAEEWNGAFETPAGRRSTTMPPPSELLAGFFRFFATEFSWGKDVRCATEREHRQAPSWMCQRSESCASTTKTALRRNKRVRRRSFPSAWDRCTRSRPAAGTAV